MQKIAEGKYHQGYFIRKGEKNIVMARKEIVDMVVNNGDADRDIGSRAVMEEEREKIKEMYFWVQAIEKALARNGLDRLFRNPRKKSYNYFSN